eukprot:scaffold5151_cov125-Isochrysis_galbana.AAC.5
MARQQPRMQGCACSNSIWKKRDCGPNQPPKFLVVRNRPVTSCVAQQAGASGVAVLRVGGLPTEPLCSPPLVLRPIVMALAHRGGTLY